MSRCWGTWWGSLLRTQGTPWRYDGSAPAFSLAGALRCAMGAWLTAVGLDVERLPPETLRDLESSPPARRV